jgi:hypothetical protein
MGDVAAATSEVGAAESHVKTVKEREACMNSLKQNLMLRRCYLVIFTATFTFLGMAGVSQSRPAGEKTFSSSGDAVLALYNAAKANDTQTLASIFGSHADQIMHTGDAVADHAMQMNFLRRYEQMHRVVIEPDQTATLYIGAENWPFPIPIAKNASGEWFFDTEAGIKEVLYRRVGANENDAIEILYSLVDAQKEYASASRDGAPAGLYAARFLSDEGKHNGLYWKTSEGETPSPIGQLLADASAEGYSAKQGEVPPFHGYYYRMITKQGVAAPGGAKDYMVNGKLKGGFAFVAYPAQYRNSGVMTFIVNKSGIVYEKDLGEKTQELAPAIDKYDPDKTWDKADE